MIKLFVFWFLVLCICVLVGFGIAYLFGDKIFDKVNEVKNVYLEEEKEEEESNYEFDE